MYQIKLFSQIFYLKLFLKHIYLGYHGYWISIISTKEDIMIANNIKLLVIMLAIFAIPFNSFSQSLEERIDVLTEEVEQLKRSGFGGEIGSQYGFGPAASKVYNTSSGLSIGGYGEIVGKFFRSEQKLDQTDAYRGVFYIGYKFTDEWSLNTELEFEHGDEAFLEFGYLDYTPKAMNGLLGFRAGLLLLPTGIINELHEPTLFHGVYRPQTETTMLPTTNRENGVGIFGETAEKQLEYKLYYLTSLKNPGVSATGNTNKNFRSKGSSSTANELAVTGSIKYNFNNKTVIGGSYYRGNIQPSGITATAYDMNDPKSRVEWRTIYIMGDVGGFEYRALYTNHKLSNIDRFNSYLTGNANTKFGTKQVGYYYELAKDLGHMIGTSWYVAPFFRYENLNYHKKTDSSATSNRSYQDLQYWNYGLTVKPIGNVVLKADALRHTNPGSNNDYTQYNLGIGWIF